MESVKLMNRTDTKYCFSQSQLIDILDELKEHYRCVEINGKRVSNYQTMYYDTTQFNLYLQHHNGKLNRYKVRRRDYIDSNISFLEIKRKNNKGRTIKSRIQTKAEDLFTDNTKEFLEKNMLNFSDNLFPVIRVDYGRITLVGKNKPERVTIDTNLCFVKNNKKVALEELIIAEVKQDKKNNSPFIQSMNKRRIFEGGISKYCLAIALTTPEVKTNNFKEKIKILNRITKNDITSSSIRSHKQ